MDRDSLSPLLNKEWSGMNPLPGMSCCKVLPFSKKRKLSANPMHLKKDCVIDEMADRGKMLSCGREKRRGLQAGKEDPISKAIR